MGRMTAVVRWLWILAAVGQSIEKVSAAEPIATGCATPQNFARTAFFVDPVHGSMSGDGSRQHPWHTLSEVFDVHSRLIANAPDTWVKGEGMIRANPKAPIRDGDIIYLMNGNHGTVQLQGYFGTAALKGLDNKDFITVTAAPGQSPVIKQLVLKGIGKWIFQGLNFQSLQDVPQNQGRPFNNHNGTQDYNLVSLQGPSHDVIFDSNSFSSGDNVGHWTPEEWMKNRVSGLSDSEGNCISITNNKFYNIGFGIGTQRASNVLIEGNIIDTFTDDGIDYGSNNLLIKHNTVINSISDGDGFHVDAMQGQPYGQVPVENVRIEDNLIIDQTKSGLVSLSNLQGIDAFDGVWRNIAIVNNVVAVGAYHGIAFYGVDGVRIINNTVIGTKQNIPTWIMVSPAKDKRPSSDAVIQNNISTSYRISTFVAFDHNMMASLSGKELKAFKPNEHVFADQMPVVLFERYNPSFFSYNFRLSRYSKAIGSGTPLLAPSQDIDGALRHIPIDLGAYVHKQ